MLRKLFKKENKAKQVVAGFGFAILSLLVLNLVVYFLWLGERPLSIGNTVKKEVVKANLSIVTDKKEYKMGEMVKITFRNLNGTSFNEASKSTAPSVAASRYMGKNYGVGMIEKYHSQGWQAIEPVWRCDNECYRKCEANRQLKPEEERTFYWPQTIVICHGLEKEEEISRVYPGRYRVSSAIYNEGTGEYRAIYSGEFVIK